VAKSKGKKKLKEMGKAKDKQKVKEVAKEKDKALGKRKMVRESCKGRPKKMNNRYVICPTCTHVFSYHAFCVEMNVHYVIIVITLLNGEILLVSIVW
jgi:hypothetical protein